MRLLFFDEGEVRVTKDLLKEDVPPYAILSHTWGEDDDEMKFQELDNPDNGKSGYKKIRLCGDQAKVDGLSYVWVDTCCIDRRDLAGLSTDINSMFRYYQNSAKCYVYLSDVDDIRDFEKSRWFTRGWTLQELLAPRSIEFFSQSWKSLGNKAQLSRHIQEITGIPLEALLGADLASFSKEERMSWSTKRNTKREEDKAYCLLGIFDVFMHPRYGEGKNKEFARLEQKIRKSSKPRVQDIDASIRDYYLNNGHLNIERLSGRCLPMERCFINLGIVDHCGNDGTQSDLEANALTLETRLGVETPERSKQVTIQTLFATQALARISDGQPKRILIWGRAGIGKTTLCKKMVHDFYYNEIWQGLYDRVFWLPLRRLRLMQDEAKTLVEMIQEVCFHGARDNAFPIDQLHDILGSRCLFILDGLDEVSGAFDPDSPMGANLKKLLSLKNIIVTSRPHGTSTLNRVLLNLELETVGFFPEQVDEYLRKETELSQDSVEEIRTFVRTYPLVKSLVRIPIQLDAICYVWSTEQFQHSDLTMTALYQAISDCLWKKDIVRLAMKFEGHRITSQQLQNCTNVTPLIEPLVSCLEKLAFDGLHNQIVEYGSAHINVVGSAHGPLFVDQILKLSFLRSSEHLMKPPHQTHHFVHLTFQEFFAARYFVRHWSSGETMQYTIKHKHTEMIPPTKFVQTDKYNPRLNVFWRFVAGLLSMSGEYHLLRFIEKLEGEPIDCLGPVHQRLIVQCLSEVHETHNAMHVKTRELENKYKDWTKFNPRPLISEAEPSCLFGIPECPDRVLLQWLEGTHKERLAGIRFLRDNSSISPNLLSTIIQQAQKTHDTEFRRYALTIISRYCDQLSEETWSNVFGSYNIHTWLASMSCSPKVGGLAARSIAPLLKDGDSLTREIVTFILYGRSEMTENVDTALVQIMLDQTSRIQMEATRMLLVRDTLSEPVINRIFQAFMDQDLHRKIRDLAAMVLKCQTALPEFILIDLLPILLQSRHSCGTQRWAAFIIMSQVNLPQNVVSALIDLLHTDSAVYFQASLALLRHNSFPESGIEKLAQMLLASDDGGTELVSYPEIPYCVDTTAVYTLQSMERLPESIIRAFVRTTQDQSQDPIVRLRAAAVLSHHNKLSEPAVEGLLRICNDQDQDTSFRYKAATILAEQTKLPEFVVEDLLPKVQSKYRYVKFCQDISYTQPHSLSGSVLDYLVEMHGHEGLFWEWEVLKVLRRVALSESHIKTMTQSLRSEVSTGGTTRVLRRRTEFYQLIPNLDSASLQNLMRSWLLNCETLRPLASYFQDDSHIYVLFIKGAVIFGDGVYQWKVPLASKELEVFRERWHEARRAIGVPMFDKDREKSNTSQKRKNSASEHDGRETRVAE